LRKVIKHLYKGIEENELVRFDSLDERDRKRLKEEARYLEKTLLWKLLIGDMIHVSQKRMFEKATEEKELLFGKAVLYTIEVIKKKVDKLKQLK